MGPFAALGEHVFDDYYMGYMTKADAKAAGLATRPYANLKEYAAYKKSLASDEAFAQAIAVSDEDAGSDDNPIEEDE